MKAVILIQAHKDLELLNRLIRAFDHRVTVTKSYKPFRSLQDLLAVRNLSKLVQIG